MTVNLSLGLVLLLLAGGFVTGFVDSIAGGGGLISLPIQTLVVGAGALAIGTNKIAGAVGTLTALLVYLRAGHVRWRKNILFAVFVGIGSLIGTQVSPFIPPTLFRWLLLATCPVILWIVWNKDLWAHEAAPPDGSRPTTEGRLTLTKQIPFFLSGLVCGFYDGAWGPGAGTFMFLSLLFVAHVPLLESLAAAKFANLSSCLVALVSYGARGYVAWLPGSLLALGVIFGSILGARSATRNSAKVVRPVLVAVVTLLLAKLLIA